MDDPITPTSQLIRTIPLSQNPAAVYLARLTSDLSKRTMRAALDKIAALDGQDAFTLHWAALRYQHTLAIRAHLAASYAPATANKLLSALRGVLKEAWRLGQMSAEDYQRAVDVENIKAETLPAGRDLSYGEIKALADVCMNDPSPAGVRDAAIIGVLATCGVRRAELASLQVENFDTESGKIIIRERQRQQGSHGLCDQRRAGCPARLAGGAGKRIRGRCSCRSIKAASYSTDAG